MSPTFTDDDVGKAVESADGDSLGIVVSVEPETAYVDPDPGTTDSIKAVLDWGSESEGAVPVTDDAVERIMDDAIRLSSSVSAESITSDEPRDAGRTTERRADRQAATGAERADDEYTPGEPVSGDTTESETGIDGTEEGPGTTAGDTSEPMIDDEHYDDLEDEPRVDPDEQLDAQPDDESRADELDAVEEAASRGLEVDPTELTGPDADAEIDPSEDLGQRTDAEVEPEMDLEERSDADVAPGHMDERRRDDAEVDPERIDSEVGEGAGVDDERTGEEDDDDTSSSQ
ncbi:aspartate-rich protein [Natrialba magadii ATCC 43099]|uniref:Aspartate-rich protein n=1 Tax=Natrialba magadii (strain ATCC 43099 / DSM 3394 / CCM 3739 / CIP 104546 / IAM 13178 / JCM 8861 / NBRC 102185 / NCIMB 2190 / MS3) TaxID=547559 RepID=D3SVK9_NATMM|nr:hypothetical protein [Natrialba magadii]ADD05617.1 aspartate-rich protein [Natrialba magadii ATCC 43099]ELY29970.1 hypothetical protein C500_10179 [Natrialba magadii ATCC 43099]